MSRGALATVDSRRSTPSSRREGRIDRVGVSSIGVASVGVAIGRVGRSVDRAVISVAAGRVAIWKASGSCKSGKDESGNDFELHIVCFLL